MRRLLFMYLLLLPFVSYAVEDDAPPRLENVPDVPESPARVKSGETLEPDITIIRKGKKNDSGISAQRQIVYGESHSRRGFAVLFTRYGRRRQNGCAK